VGQLAYGDGNIAATFGHNIPSNKDFKLHQTGALAAIDTNGDSTYSKGAGHHTYGNWVWFDGQNFVKVQQGDQGLLMSRLTRQGNSPWVWSKDKLVYRHQNAAPGNPEKDTKEFMRFGGVVNAGTRYMLLFASAPDQGGLVIDEVEWMTSVQGAALYLTTVPKARFDALPVHVVDENPVGDGLTTKRLVKPSGTNNCVRPRIADLGDGNYIVTFEEWDENRNYVQTKALVIDADGKVIRSKLPNFPNNPRIPRHGTMFVLGNRAGWVAGDNENGCIMLHLLDKSLNLESFKLDCR
jgi:hypothetical protein